MKLFKYCGCAGSLKISNDLFSFFLSNVLFKNATLFNCLLSFNKAKTGECTNNLDNVDFLVACCLKNNVELGLLFYGSCCRCACCGSCRYCYGSCCGYAELLFKCLNKLVEL